jgi:segregation and condensation protein A
LLEYRAFRDASHVLAHRLSQHEAQLPRDAPPERWVTGLVPDTPLPIDVRGLAALAAGALAPTPERSVDLSHIRRSYVSVREAALALLSALPDAGRERPFPELVAGRTRGDRVVFFLALLELFKLGHVGLEQDDHRSALHVARNDGDRDLTAMLDELSEDDAEHREDADAAPIAAATGVRS